MNGLYGEPPCSAVIPMEWSPSWPVPTGEAGGAQFKLFYYPIRRVKKSIQLHKPLGEAMFETAGGSISYCRRIPGELHELPGTSIEDKAKRHSTKKFHALLDRLYLYSEKVSVIYAAKEPPSYRQKKVMREYGELFLEFSEPPMRPYYYQLNPDFWEWLRASGAPSLPKP
ncbi:MAG: hypothetical protein ABIJ96_06445 [Elusimicrobiota bacterium]